MAGINDLLKEYQASQGGGSFASPMALRGNFDFDQSLQNKTTDSKKRFGGLAGLLIDYGLPTLTSIGGAIGGTFVAPGAGTAVGGAGGAGLGEFLRQKIQGEDTDLGRIGTEAAFGGVFSGAGKAARTGVKLGGKVIGKEIAEEAAEKTAKNTATPTSIMNKMRKGIHRTQGDQGKIETWGSNLRKKVSNPQVSASPSGAAREDLIAKSLQEEGLTGSATKQYRQLPEVMKRLSGELDETLKTNTNVGRRTDLVSGIKASTKDISEFVDADPLHIKNLNIQLKELGSKLPKDYTAADLSKAKSELGGKMSNVFKKVQSGKDLTAKEAAQYTVWKSLDGQITSLAPEAKEITRRMSMLYEAAPGLKKATQAKVNIGPIHSTSLARVKQGTEDLVGRGMQKISPNAPVTPTGMFARQGLVRPLLTGGMGSGDDGEVTMGDQINEAANAATMDAEIQSATGDLLTGMSGGAGDGGDGASGAESIFTPETLQMMALEDIQKTGGKNIDTIKSLYAMFVPEDDGTGMSTTQQKAANKMADASAIADQIEEVFAQAGGGGGVTGYLTKLGAKIPGVASEARAYESIRKASIGPLARAISGEVGVLTDRDIARAENLLPRLDDTPYEARLKLQNLRKAIQLRQANIGGMGETGDESSVLTGLLQ